MLLNPRDEMLDDMDIYDLDIDHLEDGADFEELDLDNLDNGLLDSN